MRSTFRILAFFSFVALSMPFASAQSYTSVVVFGDSLSDTGNIAHLANSQYAVRYPGPLFNYADGRFTDGTTTTPAAKAYSGVWVEQLAGQFTAKPAVTNSLDGGTNYAYGGATTADGYQTVAASSILPGAPPVSITLANMGQQVANYLDTNPTITPNTLFVLFGGANDLFADSSTAGTTAAAQREATLVQRLIAAGATNFLVLNLPPLGGTPGNVSGPNSTALNIASTLFRMLLAADLQAVQTGATAQGKTVQILQPDLFTQFLGAVSSPAQFGFSNVSTSAQGTTLNADTSVFWDTIHPTTTGHHVIAETAEATLVKLTTTTTVLTSSASVTSAQNPVTLTATVTGGTAKPTGLVTFFSGTLGSATLVGSAVLDATGKATTTFSATIAASPYSLFAVYAGDLTYLNSASAATPLTVSTAIPTSTTLLTTAGSYALGASLPLSASVTSSNGTPSGTVTFLDGSTSLGIATLNAGVANLPISTLALGTHTLSASYAVNGVYAASTSASVVITIVNPAVAISFTPQTLTLQHGSSASTTITIAPQNVAGSVALTCGSLPAHAACTFSPGTVSVTGSTASTSTLTIGTNSASALIPARPGSNPRNMPVYAALLPLFGLGFAARRRLRGRALLVLLVTLAAAGMGGCSGSSTGSAAPSTAPGTYSVVVTATVVATGVSSQATLTVVVQ